MGCLAGQRAREKERATDRRKKRGGERERESWSMVYDIPLMAVVA